MIKIDSAIFRAGFDSAPAWLGERSWGLAVIHMQGVNSHCRHSLACITKTVERWDSQKSCKMCRYLKNFSIKGLCGRFLSVWGPEPHNTHPLHTVYTLTDTYSHREGGSGGGGGEESNQREYEGATVHEAGSKYQHDWLYLQSINSDKHSAKIPFTDYFF